MSRYTTILFPNTKLAYGLNKPTGGFYWQEIDIDDNIVSERDALSLTSLINDLNNYNINPNIKILINDFLANDPEPTIVQLNIGRIFNRNIKSMLLEVMSDVISWIPNS